MNKSILPQQFARQEMSLTQIAGFYVQIVVGDQLIVCPSDEFYFSLLEALCTGQAVAMQVMAGSTTTAHAPSPGRVGEE